MELSPPAPLFNDCSDPSSVTYLWDYDSPNMPYMLLKPLSYKQNRQIYERNRNL